MDLVGETTPMLSLDEQYLIERGLRGRVFATFEHGAQRGVELDVIMVRCQCACPCARQINIRWF